MSSDEGRCNAKFSSNLSEAVGPTSRDCGPTQPFLNRKELSERKENLFVGNTQMVLCDVFAFLAACAVSMRIQIFDRVATVPGAIGFEGPSECDDLSQFNYWTERSSPLAAKLSS